MALSNFQAIVSNDLSRNNRFRVLGDATPSGDDTAFLNMLVQTVSLPGMAFNTAMWRDYSVPRKYPYDIAYNDLQITFLDTSNNLITNYYHDWMVGEGEGAIHRRTGFGYMDQYRKDLTIQKLDRKDRITYEVLVRNAYPINIDDISLDSAGTDTLTQVTVTFAYGKWEVIPVLTGELDYT